MRNRPAVPSGKSGKKGGDNDGLEKSKPARVAMCFSEPCNNSGLHNPTVRRIA